MDMLDVEKRLAKLERGLPTATSEIMRRLYQVEHTHDELLRLTKADPDVMQRMDKLEQELHALNTLRQADHAAITKHVEELHQAMCKSMLDVMTHVLRIEQATTKEPERGKYG